MYKYETHLHTAEASGCATASGAEQARRYKDEGYDGIIVTDHFFNGNCAIHNYYDWYDRVRQFCKGYENAREEGEKIGLKVFFGIEYTYFGADLLTYGVDLDWLYQNNNVMDISVYEYIKRVHDAGGIVVHAHPFREADYIKEIKLLPNWVDGVEVYNAGNKKEEFNERALWYAKQYDLPQTAGSDNHHLSSERLSGVLSETPLESINDYINAVKDRTLSGIIIPD